MSTFPQTHTTIAHPFRWSVTLAILLIVAGLFAILVPLVSGIAITLLTGWILTLAGIVHCLFAWKRHSTGSLLWELLIGLAYLVAGLYLVFHPVAGLTSLTLLLSAYLFFKGVIEIIRYFQARPLHGSTWLVVDGAINLFLAVLIWRSWPFSSVWVIGTLIGVSILFSGLSRLMLSLQTRRALQTT